VQALPCLHHHAPGRGETRFLPFSTGSEGPGRSGGAGNPPGRTRPVPDLVLWEQVWQPDAWLDLLHRFLHVEDENAKRGPGHHQW
jgi:type I restriction enzyme R subunit